MEKKITELEEKFAFLDHTIEELNNVVFRQTQKIDELETMLKHLSSQIRQMNNQKDTGDSEVINDRPPHY
ncbi:MAG: SlyX family protein [Candidatus Thioglobus sp.]|nr:SlyX family protein [Candidatus Thioglobus sp.]MBT4923044.1 SlyX family protein [Candidatus Thioglobus sp.]MBT5286858.1 SlyX family protein [Candidatus Thioglobus sp.]MBT6327819.1 SlyX family protein [Candidatus Thioglobus sp.]MBT6656082.1 SlyX family protein [Candidatus Thioglobus sp.]